MVIDILKADSISETILRVSLIVARKSLTDGITGTFLADLDQLVNEATEHIRTMITGDLATVTDAEGVAHEWNEAILFAIQTVENA